MKLLRLALLGFGTVGQWLAQALQAQHAWLQQEYDVGLTITSVATAHHGLIYRGDGLDIPTLLELVATRQPLSAHPKVTHWTNVLEGLQAKPRHGWWLSRSFDEGGACWLAMREDSWVY